MYNKAYLSYLPEYLGRIREMRALAEVIDTYLTETESQNDVIMREGIIGTAENTGLEMWEKLLGITKGGTLEERRRRLLTYLADSTPYDFTDVLNMLKSICGDDKVRMNYGAEEYTLEVWVKPAAEESTSAAEALLKRLLPANMVFEIKADYTQYYELEEKKHSELSQFRQIEIRRRLWEDLQSI